MSNASIRILLVDDEPDILEIISYNLINEGYQVFTAENGKQAIKIAKKQEPHLIILDVMMPVMDGIEACQKIRQIPKLQDSIITFLTARAEDYAQISGLEAGADDYITKPFSILELISRVKAVLRRSQKKDTDHISYKDLRLNMKKRSVKVDGEKIDLTYKEFEMLLLFMSNIGNVITRDDFLLKVWGYDYEGETRTVDVHIASLRAKLKDAGKYIETVRNLGYKFGEI